VNAAEPPEAWDEVIAARRMPAGTLARVLLLAAVLVLSSCRTAQFMVANAPSGFARIDRHRDLPYGQDKRQKLDLYAPRNAARAPVVIFWYGGSWVMGSKSEYRFVGSTLAQRGFVAVLPDYRLYPQVTFPLFDEDGAKALAWVQQHVVDYGGNPHCIVLMGHSAGAHTAAFLAYNRDFTSKAGADPDGIAALVGLSGPYALVPDTDELRATFPAPYTPKDWQPIAFVTAQAPPTLLLHGQADKDVDPGQAVELRDALSRLTVPAQLQLYPRRGHGSTVASFALVARRATSAVSDTTAFVNQVCKGR
jgi:acetyl esterase/lipase